MRFWTHRVMRRKIKGEYFYGIHEVHFDTPEKIEGWTEEEMAPCGDSLNELKDAVKFFRKALDEPVLDYETGKAIDG